MALVYCPECQREISDQSQCCIHCGFPMVKDFKDHHLINVLVKNDEKRAKNLMTRAQLELEDKEYTKAEALTEQALELEPKFFEAYLVKLWVLLQVSDENEMINKADRPLTDYKDYNRALRFAQGEDREKLMEYNRQVLDRFEKEKQEKIYQVAKNQMNHGMTEEDYETVAEKLETISQYKDALALSKEARRLAEEEKQQGIYLQALEKMESAKDKDPEQAAAYLLEAGKLFESIENYKDAQVRKIECDETSLGLKRELTYQKGIQKKENARQEQEYQEAAGLFYKIEGYKDADALGEECEALGRKVGADYLDALLKKRKRKKILKKVFVTTAVVLVLVVVILGGLTNFTYSLEEYNNIQQGQGEYFWWEAFEQIKSWFIYAGNIF